ncbi:hypothetical protein [Neorhizobium sp. SOG26]|uniref:hypothetical protein n=1 Tax=Neorhizobium sp. SOG26 TaxID=2060726 RepID=UPI001900913B|nr:hypothetical protein [Neorhizobium sp. SOG26]
MAMLEKSTAAKPQAVIVIQSGRLMSVSANVVILTLDRGSMGDEAFVFINYRYRKSFVISSTEVPSSLFAGSDEQSPAKSIFEEN